jgi:hypothetical protein
MHAVIHCRGDEEKGIHDVIHCHGETTCQGLPTCLASVTHCAETNLDSRTNDRARALWHATRCDTENRRHDAEETCFFDQRGGLPLGLLPLRDLPRQSLHTPNKRLHLRGSLPPQQPRPWQPRSP